MKLLNRDRTRRAALTVALTAILIAASALLYDCVQQVSTSAAFTQRLQAVEEAARSDRTATAEFEGEVNRQTSISLARAQRQHTAGIVLLAASAICVGLMKWKLRAEEKLPIRILEAIAANKRVECANGKGSAQRCQATPPEVDLLYVDIIVSRIGHDGSQLLPLLLAIDEHYHYLPPAALIRLAEVTGISRAQIAEVASFYSKFRTTPRGKHVVQVCCGTACHVAGADRILEETRRVLHIPPGCDTDPDGNATVEVVGCLGCCTLAPVLRVDNTTLGHVEVQSLPRSLQRVLTPASVSETELNGTPSTPILPTEGQELEIRVGLGSCCVAGGSQEVLATLRREIARRRLNARLKTVGCVGICHLTPLVEVVREGAEPIMATRVSSADVERIVRSLPDNSPWPQRMRNRLRDIRSHTNATRTPLPVPCQIRPTSDVNLRRFLDPQVRIVTEHSGSMDPTSLDEYRLRGGFEALRGVLEEHNPDRIVDIVQQSGLRGRGGAGYPTHAKWRMVQGAAGPKYVICNGDEGDPGAFMDRMIMESYPYRVLEGLAIAAYTVGADRALVYVRHEYPLAVKRLKAAIEQMTTAHLLGDNVLRSHWSLHVEIVEGGGAFVCGEETALLESVMGRRGTPQIRPPYPAERGLFDRPTLVNNVETLANIPWIVRNGAERFASLGTQSSNGTKVFALAGKVRHGGLIEIPMGLTIRQVVESIGGGVADGRKFKAVQIGGPSGGCIPAELADTPIDYESLRQLGAIMGSGGLIVLDNDDCMVDLARYFLEFTQRESCGHCTLCRVGTRKLLDLLERLCAGKGHPRDLVEIEALSQAITSGSMCGLGKTAPNPVVTTLKYFRHEYEAHLNGMCPAGRCKALIRYEVTHECTGCTLCAQHCPVGAIRPTPYQQHWIDPQVCTRCDVCRTCCPEHAIRVI